MENESVILQAGRVFVKIIWDFVYFPFWWYTTGFLRALAGTGRFLRNQEASLGFLIWLKNIFVPMYGQHDIASRAISFVIRLLQIIFRGAALLILFALSLAFIAFYLALPLALLWACWYQIF